MVHSLVPPCAKAEIDLQYMAEGTDQLVFKLVSRGNTNAVLSLRAITMTVNLDVDGDGLLNSVETHTGVFNGPNDTGSDPYNPDTDGDGIPDRWEVSHGLNPNSPIDTTLDSDGDRQNNLAEFLAGTDPTNLASTFRITAEEKMGADIRVSFTSVGGKNYCLDRCHFVGAAWTTIVDNIPGTDAIRQAMDIGGASRASAIYRVRLNQSPNPAMTDSDGDGIPDAWMQLYFGHATGQAGDHSLAGDNADGDGFFNMQEYLAGTDPTNSASAFRILSVAREGSELRVTWFAAARL